MVPNVAAITFLVVWVEPDQQPVLHSPKQTALSRGFDSNTALPLFRIDGGSVSAVFVPNFVQGRLTLILKGEGSLTGLTFFPTRIYLLGISCIFALSKIFQFSKRSSPNQQGPEGRLIVRDDCRYKASQIYYTVKYVSYRNANPKYWMAVCIKVEGS